MAAATTEFMFRGGVLRNMLQPLQEHERSEELLSGIDAATLHAIANCSSTEWLPGAMGIEIERRTYDLLGPQETAWLAQRAVQMMLESTLFRAAARGMRSVFGNAPRTLFRQFPRGFDLSARGIGTLVVEEMDTDPNALIVHWKGLPPICRCDAWLGWQVGTLTGFLEDLCAAKGSVKPDGSQLDLGVGSFAVTWS